LVWQGALRQCFTAADADVTEDRAAELLAELFLQKRVSQEVW